MRRGGLSGGGTIRIAYEKECEREWRWLERGTHSRTPRSNHANPALQNYGYQPIRKKKRINKMADRLV